MTAPDLTPSAPERIQLKRTKGWRKPDGAIVVSRPSRWGNPFTVAGAIENGYLDEPPGSIRRMCVSMYRAWLAKPEHEWWHGRERAHRIQAELHELRGHDLACWCPLDQPCHADVLLELANPRA